MNPKFQTRASKVREAIETMLNFSMFIKKQISSLVVSVSRITKKKFSCCFEAKEKGDFFASSQQISYAFLCATLLENYHTKL